MLYLILNFWYLICFFILIVLYKIFEAKIKGFFGENAVAKVLSTLDKDKYKVLNNVMIPLNNGKTSQIDHVVISVYGIFVIETKNYKGWILGSEESYNWTQVIYKRKEKLLNPIIQNKGHVKALSELLNGFNNLIFYSIVVFTTRADLKINVKSDVVYTVNLLETIKKHQEYEVLTQSEVTKIVETIFCSNIEDKKAKRTHIQNIRLKKDKIQSNRCPKCGGILIERKGKYGLFKGCSNYPKCRFTLRV